MDRRSNALRLGLLSKFSPCAGSSWFKHALLCFSVGTTEPSEWDQVGNCTQWNNNTICLPTPSPVPHYLNISKELPLEYARPM